ncbi:hypothetical protein QR680_005487 [Steinernema hermaphroditum]|uniref:Uncharacterized protein n=1 Tax=Steinernema hermaphroditum TaxID=289476 RepID=A0AA39HS75_9BILA|nr:hypothetical protein QR680_005487 [Steinernema hermaphroditum]
MKPFLSGLVFFISALAIWAMSMDFEPDDPLFASDQCRDGACRFTTLEFVTRRMVEGDDAVDTGIAACTYYMASSMNVELKRGFTILQMVMINQPETARLCVDGILRSRFSIEYSSKLPVERTTERTRFSALNHTLLIDNVDSALNMQLQVTYPRLSLKTSSSEKDCCSAEIRRIGYGTVTLLEKCPKDCAEHAHTWHNDEHLLNLKPVADSSPLLKLSQKLFSQTEPENNATKKVEKKERFWDDSRNIFYVVTLALYFALVVVIIVALIAFCNWYKNRTREYDEWMKKVGLKSKEQKEEKEEKEDKKGKKGKEGKEGKEEEVPIQQKVVDEKNGKKPSDAKVPQADQPAPNTAAQPAPNLCVQSAAK